MLARGYGERIFIEPFDIIDACRLNEVIQRPGHALEGGFVANQFEYAALTNDPEGRAVRSIDPESLTSIEEFCVGGYERRFVSFDAAQLASLSDPVEFAVHDTEIPAEARFGTEPMVDFVTAHPN